MRKFIALILCMTVMSGLHAGKKSHKMIKDMRQKAVEKIQTLWIYRIHESDPSRFYFHIGRYDALLQAEKALKGRRNRR